MSITEKIINKYIIKEGYDYDTSLADTISNIIENNYKKDVSTWLKKVKKEVLNFKKSGKIDKKNWKEFIQDLKDNLEVTYDYELHDSNTKDSNKKAHAVKIILDELK